MTRSEAQARAAAWVCRVDTAGGEVTRQDLATAKKLFHTRMLSGAEFRPIALRLQCLFRKPIAIGAVLGVALTFSE